MKTLVYLSVLIATALAMPQQQAAVQQEASPAANPAPPAQAAPPHTGRQTNTAPQAEILPKQFYGPGLRLTGGFAFPPNQQQLRVAKQVVASNPSVRVRVLKNGEFEFTDEFGSELDVRDRFNRDPLEILDPQEQFELEQERREEQFLFKQRQVEIDAKIAELNRLRAALQPQRTAAANAAV